MFTPFVLKKSFHVLGALLCLVVGMPSGAYAGFEWTPPTPAPAAPQTENNKVEIADPSLPLTPELDSNLPAPVGNVEVEPVENKVSPATPPAVLNSDVSTVPTEPISKADANSAVIAPEVSVVSKLADSPLPSDKIVEGFGKDIPLAIALRDIVPANYAYVFSPKDIAGFKISWRGGKPWKDVLQLALTPYNLFATANGNQLVITGQIPPIESAQMTAPAAPPVPLIETPSSTEIQTTNPAPQITLPATLPVVDLKMNKRWEARPGTTLRDTLESWAKSAKAELNWSTPYDYPINNAFYFDGSFTDAVESLLSSYGGETPSPKGRLYPNLPDGPSVLMIH